MRPEDMLRKLAKRVDSRRYDVVSIGYPGPVVRGRIMQEPHNLAPGWVGFDFEKAFGRPTRIVNDAAMQALGSYSGGRMLLLGLGTGLGSAMILDGVLAPMELAHLPFERGKTFEDAVGHRGLLRLGRRKWQKKVFEVVAVLAAALEPEYVVLGGGNVRKMETLPPGTRRGDNRNARLGGLRLWSEEFRSASAPHATGNPSGTAARAGRAQSHSAGRVAGPRRRSAR